MNQTKPKIRRTRRKLTQHWERFAEDAATGTFTQKQLAEKYGISRTHVGRVIRGESRPPVGRRIREILELTRQACLRLLGSRLQQAVATLVAHLNHEDARIAQSAAKKVLDLGLSAESLLLGAGDEAAWEIPDGMWSEEDAPEGKESNP